VAPLRLRGVPPRAPIEELRREAREIQVLLSDLAIEAGVGKSVIGEGLIGRTAAQVRRGVTALPPELQANHMANKLLRRLNEIRRELSGGRPPGTPREFRRIPKHPDRPKPPRLKPNWGPSGWDWD
jgi:hypothetical protein